MSRFDGIENPGSYLSAQRHDWYSIENLIAYGERPSIQVSSSKGGRDRANDPAPVASTAKDGIHVANRSEPIPVVQQTTNRGAA